MKKYVEVDREPVVGDMVKVVNAKGQNRLDNKKLEYIDEENKKYNDKGKISEDSAYKLEHYFIFAKEAVNDKKARIIRGEIFEQILFDCLNVNTLF